MTSKYSRRTFMAAGGLGVGAVLSGSVFAGDQKNKSGLNKIGGFDQTKTSVDPNAQWQPFTDRKIKVGLVGYGFCKFSTQFSFQSHPNVEVAAVSDLFPDRCDELAKAVKCSKKYSSLEEMLKDDSIEAIFLATDAPSHAKQAIDVLNHGKHVCHAVPAIYGNIEDADRLYECVRKHKDLVYAMFETSCFHSDIYAMEQIYEQGGFGRLIYSEGEYCHTKKPGSPAYPSYKDWRMSRCPIWYPTHATAYYVGVTHKYFIDVSCKGVRQYVDTGMDNPKFRGEIGLFRTPEDGLSRMMVCSAYGRYLEAGRVRGEIGGYDGTFIDDPKQAYTGTDEGRKIVNKIGNHLLKYKLPPGVEPGSHGGSHGYLCDDFVNAILRGKRAKVDIGDALNMSVPGYYAHLSAQKDGETLKIPHYENL